MLAQHMIAAVQSPIPWNQGEVDVGVTIGIALVTPEDNDPDALLHAADLAMYQGKREGRGTFRFFQAEMGIALKARAQLESDLRLAISEARSRRSFSRLSSSRQKSWLASRCWRVGIIPPTA